jgi:hypothetical protein
MANARKSISAKEVSADIKSGMTDEQLMKKYGLSQKGVEALFQKLLNAGVISQAQIAEREVSQQRMQAPDALQNPVSETAKIANVSESTAERSNPVDMEAFPVQAVMGAKGQWSLQLDADALRIDSTDGTGQIVVPRSERHEKVEVRSSRFMPSLIVIHEPKKKGFKLDGTQLEAVTRWLGPATKENLRVVLRRRFKFCLAIGVILIALSVPLPGDPATGLKAVPFDIFGAVLGLALVALAFVSRYWISRNIFLLDGLWFMLVAGNVAYGVYKGDSPWWLIGSAFLIYFAVDGFKEYTRFKDVRDR